MNTHIQEQYQYIVRLICQKRLKDAFAELKEFLVKVHEWELQNKLEQIETAYTYMLEYMQKGISDPLRKKLYNKLLIDTLGIADQALLARLSLVLGRRYFKVKHELSEEAPQHTLESIMLELEAYTENYAVASLLKEDNDSTQLHEIRARHEEMQAKLFALVWTTSAWNPEEEEVAKKMLSSALVSTHDLCLFVSAVTLSLMECFDLRKFMYLFDAYLHESNVVNQRVLVGLVIMFQVYHDRMPFYPEIKARLDFLNEDLTFAHDISRVQLQILRSRDTDKIDKKMREEIIPEMMRNANIHQMRINPDEQDEENEDLNPDWAQDIEDSPLADKLREMSELQMEGADVYMSTFSQLKHYPFFKHIHNWFYPFDKQHSLVVDEMSGYGESSILDLILDSGFFCDSDKYSLCFTIMHIPKAQRESMISQMSEQQINEFLDERKMRESTEIVLKPEFITNQYVHSLYRFFKLYPRKHEFYDIFSDPIRLHEYPILKDTIYRKELLQNLGEFYFRKEHYVEASEVYIALLDKKGKDAETYQKLGYCYQKLKNYHKAIDAYIKADVLNPDNVWTNRHLAICYRMLKKYATAVAYYKKVEEVQPENLSLLFNTGSCLAELEQHHEALQYFFKLDFLEPHNIRTWRAIAWCSFMVKKLDQAMKYYDKILEKKGVAPDYLNAGHVAWSMGNMQRAMELYAKSCQLSGDKTLFLDMFNKDKEYLVQNNVDEDDIALMYDLL